MSGRTGQTIALDVIGNAGAMLFAASATQGTFFDSITVSSDVDWAIGQIRYAVIPDLTISKTHRMVPTQTQWAVKALGWHVNSRSR